jgi:outer membrane protein OmpA-like peptidoglycan-associated protein
MKPIFLSVLFSLSVAMAGAQEYDPEKMDKKAVSLFNEAQAKAEDGDFSQAISLAKKAIDKEKKFLDAWVFLAFVYSNDKQHSESIKAYETAFAIDSIYSREYKLPYSINLAGLGRFEDALNAVNGLLAATRLNPNTRKAAEYRKRSYEFAIENARQVDKNYVFAPQNIGAGINSEESEYFPSITIDDKELVFTRKVNFVNEDFFHSYKKGTSWDAAKPMEGDVNTPQNEGALNISQDGQLIVFTACDRRDGFGSCDIYMSFRTDNGWTEAVNLGGRINTDQWESQPCLSPDKRDLYFASRRFGGYGGSDIYVSRMQPNGKWGDPENLGPTVNTAGDEQCPFIHADNQTLYFTSNGLLGYGDHDLYFAKKGPGNNWAKPVNLGYPINTINQEGTLFIAADGKTAYYSSDRSEGKGGLDIYSFELREAVRPNKTLWVKGRVFDNKTKKGLPSAVELIDLATKQPLSKVQTDETGNYLITLPVGKDYAFNVNRKGYLFYSDHFFLSKSTPDSTYEKNIPLQPIEANASVVLKNIFFDVNQYELKPASQVELDRIVQLLAENPSVKIEISGHTDNEGKPADNLVLSNNRAKAVTNYLVSKGIAAQRLVSKGYGETKPVANNQTEEGRAVNRRTEMKVISQ